MPSLTLPGFACLSLTIKFKCMKTDKKAMFEITWKDSFNQPWLALEPTLKAAQLYHELKEAEKQGKAKNVIIKKIQ